MSFNKPGIYIFIAAEKIMNTLNIYEEIIPKIIKSYGSLTIVNFNKIIHKKILSKKRIEQDIREKKFSSLNLKVVTPLNEVDFINYIHRKNIYAFDSLGKTFLFFKIRHLINKKNIKLILYQDRGAISDAHSYYEINHIKGYLFILTKKLTKFLYRFLVLVNYFPNIFIYFESRKKIYKNCILNRRVKLSKLFSSLNIQYFQNIFLINSIAYTKIKNKIKSENRIVFLDGNYQHPSILMREKKHAIKANEYIKKLRDLFQELEKKFNQKVEICLHPTANKINYKKLFPKNLVTQNSTRKSIKSASIVIFHESSVVFDAVYLKKKIISLKTKFLGSWYLSRIQYYQKELKFCSVDLDNFKSIDKENFLKSLNASIKNYDKYIHNNLNADQKNQGSEKVIKILRKLSL